MHEHKSVQTCIEGFSNQAFLTTENNTTTQIPTYGIIVCLSVRLSVRLSADQNDHQVLRRAPYGFICALCPFKSRRLNRAWIVHMFGGGSTPS